MIGAGPRPRKQTCGCPDGSIEIEIAIVDQFAQRLRDHMFGSK